MGLRKSAHWQGRTPREYLIADINDWLRAATKDDAIGIQDNTRMSRGELELVCRAIDAITAGKLGT